MTWKPRLNARVDRARARHRDARRRRTGPTNDPAPTYEALVAQARPAQPIAMVTPEEREAELRAAGTAAEAKPQRTPNTTPRPEPPPPQPGMPTEPTPGMLWAEERCRWA
jgi:hypothetical protein